MLCFNNWTFWPLICDIREWKGKWKKDNSKEKRKYKTKKDKIILGGLFLDSVVPLTNSIGLDFCIFDLICFIFLYLLLKWKAFSATTICQADFRPMWFYSVFNHFTQLSQNIWHQRMEEGMKTGKQQRNTKKIENNTLKALYWLICEDNTITRENVNKSPEKRIEHIPSNWTIIDCNGHNCRQMGEGSL